MRSKLGRYCASFSFVGLVSAAVLFAISLTPSLLPRIYVVQGLLSGIALAVGYGIGVLVAWLWQYLELPEPRGRVASALKWLATLGAVVLGVIFLWRQRSGRTRFAN